MAQSLGKNFNENEGKSGTAPEKKAPALDNAVKSPPLSCKNSFKRPVFALEILVSIKENFPKPLMEYWGGETVRDTFLWFKKAQKKALEVGAKYLCIYFNLEEDEAEIPSAVALFEKIQSEAEIPLIIRGSGHKGFDAKLLPELVNKVNKPAIVAFAQDLNYQEIVKSVILSKYKDDIRLVLRAPIDINLTKELNILAQDAGLNPKNIIMDPDTGCIGMGLDYGYSVIERLVIARQGGDEVLNPPVIVFSGEESFKSKESKSDDFKDTRGKLQTRFSTVEIATTMALIQAGADILVSENPMTIQAIIPLYSRSSQNTGREV